MTTRIGLIGDPHGYPAPVREALELFDSKGITMVWCTGDIAGYGANVEETAALLQAHGCRTIVGNHDLWWLDETAGSPETPTHEYLRNLPAAITKTLEGVTLSMVHAHPPAAVSGSIRLLDQQGGLMAAAKQDWTERLADFDSDVLIVGHAHQVYAEQLGKTLVISPGSTQFNHSCAVLNLPEMKVEWFALSGQEIQPIWNWSDEVRNT